MKIRWRRGQKAPPTGVKEVGIDQLAERNVQQMETGQNDVGLVHHLVASKQLPNYFQVYFSSRAFHQYLNEAGNSNEAIADFVRVLEQLHHPKSDETRMYAILSGYRDRLVNEALTLSSRASHNSVVDTSEDILSHIINKSPVVLYAVSDPNIMQEELFSSPHAVVNLKP